MSIVPETGMDGEWVDKVFIINGLRRPVPES